MREREADVLFESWARWCLHGKVGLPQQSASIIYKLVQNSGVWSRGKQQTVVLDSIEARVESILMTLHQDDPLTVKVLRHEYVYPAIDKSDDRAINQLQRSKRVGVSLRTYRRRLAKAKKYVMEKIKDNRDSD